LYSIHVAGDGAIDAKEFQNALKFGNLASIENTARVHDWEELGLRAKAIRQI
jgi:hypothetical protein